MILERMKKKGITTEKLLWSSQQKGVPTVPERAYEQHTQQVRNINKNPFSQ